MASRFAQMSQRDCSVPMLRVKMSRRRSQAQKENRDLAVSRHRGLHRLPEQEGMDQGAIQPDLQDKKHSIAVEDRKKMLARYKEAKELQKEKERRALEKKGGVFKVGVYKPQPLASLPQAPAKTKTTLNSLSNKATSSVKLQHPLKPLVQKAKVSVPRKGVAGALRRPAQPNNLPDLQAVPSKPAVKPVKTGIAQKPQLAPPTGISKPALAERTTRAQAVRTATKTQTAPPPGRGKTAPGPHGRSVKKDGNPEQKPVVIKNKLAAGTGQKIKECKVEMPTRPPLSSAAPPEGREEPLRRDAAPDERTPSPSFAPQGFIFEPPAGVSSFPPGPQDTVLKEASLSPSPSAGTPVAVISDPPAAPEARPEPLCPSLSPPNPATSQSASDSQEPEHDVQYFRAVMASEANRLMELCCQWDPRTEEPTIPEEVRERVRTAVGQARLLMRERFGQFQGLVDDCALGRGEKVTTCADLQGFWDMVFFQVEDVNRKFNNLKEAESRGWKGEQKPLPQVKRAPKKPPLMAVAGTAAGEGGARAAARSRLAAVKAAMKAKREAESQRAPDTPAGEVPPQPPAEAQTVVFHGGFFLVESPAKVSGSVRRTSVLGASSSSFTPSRVRTPRRLVLPPASSPYLTPRVTPTCQTNPAGQVSLYPSPRPRPSPSVCPATPPPDFSLTTEQEAHSGAPDEVCHLTPCPVSSALCSVSHAPSPASSTLCYVSPVPCQVSPASLHLSPASFPSNPAPCSAISTLCSVSPAPCKISAASSPLSPASFPSNPAPCSAISTLCSVSPAPCQISPAPFPSNPALSPASSTLCSVGHAPSPVSSTLCSVSPTPCQVSPASRPLSPTSFLSNPAPSPASSTLCFVSPASSHLRSAPCSVSPPAAPMSTDPFILSPASSTLCSVSPASCAMSPASPTPTCHSGPPDTPLASLSGEQEATDASRSTPPTPVPREMSNSPEIGKVYLEPQVGAVEGDGESSSPCQRSAYSPSQWQGLNFTLSPSAFPATPAQLLQLSPKDSSPMLQSPPFTTRPLPLPEDHLKSGCTADRNPVSPAHHPVGSAPTDLSDHANARLPSPTTERPPEAVSLSAPADPVPQEVSSHSGIREVYLEPQEGAVDGEFSSPSQRSAYSPSQWQGLNFTLSPSAFPPTPARLLLLSPKDYSPMVQSPPPTTRPLPQPLDHLTPGCVTDRCSLAAARVQMSPAVAETSDVSDVPGLDFDSPDVPNKRCGLSPRAAVTMETWPSPATQMESSGLECKNLFEGDVTGGTE